MITPTTRDLKEPCGSEAFLFLEGFALRGTP
jgi:hypothetical protein